jgi:hypothetical protein
VHYFVLYLVFLLMKKGGREFVVLCDAEDGLPFSVLSVIAEGEVEHPRNVTSVCCQLMFTSVVG